MSTSERWPVKLSLIEIDGETHAEARLTMDDGEDLRGKGTARLNPADRDVVRIGEQIAAARALADLAHKVLDAAAAGIENATHTKPHLHL
jgi:hypothetical protein